MNSSKRVPPQNLEAETALLSSVLVDSAALPRVIDLLEPQYFYDLRNSILFEHIKAIYKENRPVDVVTLTSKLKKLSLLKQAGGATYLTEIISEVPTSANVEEYAYLIRDAAIRRQLISLAGEIDSVSREEQRELPDIVDEIQKKILGVSSENVQQDFFDSQTLLEMQMERADEYARNPESLRGLPTGINSLDEKLQGLHKSDLIIVAARPSVGKSAFVFDIARYIAVSDKKTVAIFSLEMPGVQVIERMIAQESRINLWNIRMANLRENEYKRYNEGVAKLSESKIFIDETSGINIMQIRSKARKLKMEHGLDLLVIDYLQLMQGRGNIENRAQEIAEISRSLKILARELNIPIVALSQLNRAVENRMDKIPQLSDLRESGSIEQDADIVIFLGRDVIADEEADPSNVKVDVFIAKHRNGPTGRFQLSFVSPQTKFLDIEQAASN